MCEPMLAGGLLGGSIGKAHEKKKEREKRDHDKLMAGFTNATDPNQQPTAKKNPTEKTKMNTGVNIGGQY